MEKFIALSPSTTKALLVAQMSIKLPINILIYGEQGVGKKVFAKTILPNIYDFEAVELERLLKNKTIELNNYKMIIVYNIDNIINKKEFFNYLKNIKIIATASQNYTDTLNIFAVKIEIEPLKNRIEDLNSLKQYYIKKAKNLYNTEEDINDIPIDLTLNAISLKQSIFKNILLKSITKTDIQDILQEFILKELHKGNIKTYKDFIDFFEKPLLNAAKIKYKSQLQMAKELQINRVTLRKKLSKMEEL